MDPLEICDVVEDGEVLEPLNSRHVAAIKADRSDVYKEQPEFMSMMSMNVPEERTMIDGFLMRADQLSDFDTFFPKRSLLANCLTKEIWEEYKNQKCNQGVPFKTCIFSGIKNQDSDIGVYAGSHDSYKTFHKLFDHVI
jgi:arginine kinase